MPRSSQNQSKQNQSGRRVIPAERRRARKMALQVLYEVDLVSHSAPSVLHEHFANASDLNASVQEYCTELVLGVVGCQDLLDHYIQVHAPEWPLEQVALVDRNLLRMALYEFTFGGIPTKVAINEAVELAKIFGADSAPRFVNGVLGALVPKREEILQSLEEIQDSSK